MKEHVIQCYQRFLVKKIFPLLFCLFIFLFVKRYGEISYLSIILLEVRVFKLAK